MISEVHMDGVLPPKVDMFLQKYENIKNAPKLTNLIIKKLS